MTTVIDEKERARLDVLERSGLLNKDTEERLSHLTYTAHWLLDVDASEINLITETEQRHAAWWPLRSIAATEEAHPRETSGCQIVVQQDQPLAINDTRYNNVCSGMPWAALYHGYLGVPIHYEGVPVGSFCVLTYAPREWNSRDTMGLRGLVNLVELMLPLT